MKTKSTIFHRKLMIKTASLIVNKNLTLLFVSRNVFRVAMAIGQELSLGYCFMASVHSCLSLENRSCLSNFSYSHCLLSDVD